MHRKVGSTLVYGVFTRLPLSFLLLLTGATAYASPKQSECFITMTLDSKHASIGQSGSLCDEQIYAASTFKIPLALMVFDSGLLKDETSSFKWDGSKQPFPAWEQDQRVTSWLKYSVIWCSQQLTSKLGLARIERYLKQWSYGNQDFSGGLTRAWLSSSLKISAKEQVEFLRRLWRKELSSATSAVEKTIAVLPKTDDTSNIVILGKTGTAFSWEDPSSSEGSESFQIGWYVGYFTKNKKPHSFAMVLKEPSKRGRFESVGNKARSRAIALINEGRF